jgi:hypothetical protein
MNIFKVTTREESKISHCICLSSWDLVIRKLNAVSNGDIIKNSVADHLAGSGILYADPEKSIVKKFKYIYANFSVHKLVLWAIFEQKFIFTKFYIEQDLDPDPFFSEVGSGSASKLSGSAALIKNL